MAGNRIAATVPIDPLALDLLGEIAPVEIAPSDDHATLVGMMAGTVGIVARGRAFIDAEIMDAAQELVVIGRTGAGYDTVDIEAATARGIPVVYAPVHGYAVAEATFAMMLALARRLFYWHDSLLSGHWDRRIIERTHDLDGTTLGIVGLGRIGREVARRAQAFNMKIVAADPYVSPERATEVGAELVSLEELLAQSDYITIHALLTPDTRGLINQENLRNVKQGACLINFARGELVESLDILYESLQDGRLGAVGLDVFPVEPPPSLQHPLFHHPNFVGSPHVLASSYGAEERIYRSMCKDMIAVFQGHRPEWLVNPEVFERKSTA